MTSTTNPHYTAEPIKKENTKDGRTIFEPRQLNIVWGSDARYWRLPGQSDSKNEDMSVESAAELLQVSWLEVTGSMELQTGKKYEVGFKVSLKADAFGWSGIPVYLMAKVGKKGKYKWTKIYLADSKQEEHKIPVDPPIAAATDKSSSSSTDNTLYFGLYEVWSGKWKGGLLIHNAFVQECSP